MTYTPSSLIGKAGLLFFAQNERRMPGIDWVSFQFWSQNKAKGEFKMSKEIYENAITAAKAFCKAEVTAGRCEPDQCDICPAQEFMDMVMERGRLPICEEDD